MLLVLGIFSGTFWDIHPFPRKVQSGPSLTKQQLLHLEDQYLEDLGGKLCQSLIGKIVYCVDMRQDAQTGLSGLYYSSVSESLLRSDIERIVISM